MSAQHEAYNRHRKNRFHHEKLSAAERRRARRMHRDQRTNFDADRFGKINWYAYDHPGLWHMIHTARPSEMGDKAYKWATLANDVESATREVSKALNTITASWRGQSADAAASSMSALATWGNSASDTARQIGAHLDSYTGAVQHAQHTMPEPVHPYMEKWFRQGYDASVFNSPDSAYVLKQLLDDHQPSFKERDDRRRKAVEVMEAYESHSKGVYSSLPQFSSAPVTTSGTGSAPAGNPAPAPAPASGGPAPAPPGQPPAPAPGQHSLRPSDGGPSSSFAVGAYAGGEAPGSTDTPIGSDVHPEDIGGHDGSWLADGGTSAAAALSPTAGLSSSGGVGAGGLAGGIGGGYAGGGVPGAGSVPGEPGLVSAPISGSGSAGAAASRVASSLGATRGAGAGGMYPPMGPGGRGDEDREHRNKYCEPMDLMDDLPPVYPPVLGAD